MDLYTVRNSIISGKQLQDLNLRVVFYARVSTDKDEQLHSLNSQVTFFEEYIKKRERADEQRAAKEAAKAKGLDHIELDDDATVEYKESVAQQIEEDRALLDSELGEEDDY